MGCSKTKEDTPLETRPPAPWTAAAGSKLVDQESAEDNGSISRLRNRDCSENPQTEKFQLYVLEIAPMKGLCLKKKTKKQESTQFKIIQIILKATRKHRSFFTFKKNTKSSLIKEGPLLAAQIRSFLSLLRAEQI